MNRTYPQRFQQVRKVKRCRYPDRRDILGRGRKGGAETAGRRLLALDVDGTLLRSDNTLSRRNAAAVISARNLGWHVLLATGKPPWAIRTLAARLSLTGTHIVANGSALWTQADGTEVLARIPDAGVRTSLAYAARYCIPRAVSGPRGVFTQATWGVPALTAALHEVGEDAPTVVPDAVAAEPDPWKVILIQRTDQRHPPVPAVEGGQWVRTGPAFHETLPAGSSKGTAMRLLCQRLGIAREDVIAFGDSENDIDLLQWAGTGIAMAHAPQAVRGAAAATTAGNDEDGVAQALEPLLD